MTSTERARRSDSLYFGYVKRRELCDMVAQREHEVEDLMSENVKLRELMRGMRLCSNDDADGRKCPLYDESEPYRCKKERLLSELGLGDGE